MKLRIRTRSWFMQKESKTVDVCMLRLDLLRDKRQDNLLRYKNGHSCTQ